MTDADPSRIADWSARLSAAGTPVFARTVREVASVSSNRVASARDLSDVVSQDASMTARLLRIANSPVFNPQNRQVDTVSAAVVMLGFDAVRELSISLALIEQVLQGRPHARVTQGLARAFHAAAQAKSFARLRGDRCPEEVFVAALLYQVGEVAFWSADASERETIERHVTAGMPVETAERTVLGFSLRELSQRLAADWSLGELLQETLDGRIDAAGRSAHIALGHSIARVIEEHGKDAPDTASVIRRLAAHLDADPEKVRQLVDENLEDALRIARSYGVEKLETVLPRAAAAVTEATGDGNGGPELSLPARQLVVLAAVAANLESDVPLDTQMRRLLAGAHESIGFDRTYFAILTPDRGSLQAKYVFGLSPTGFEGSRRPLRGSNDFFLKLFEGGRTGLFRPGDKAADVVNMGWLCVGECLCMPVVLNGKPIGVLYADRARSREPVTEEDLAAFRLFGFQIPLILMQARKPA